MNNPSLQLLSEKISERTVIVGVIGLGYVGLPLSLAFMRRGIQVMGFDADPVKVDKLNRGESYIKHLPAAELAGFTTEKMFEATSDFARLSEPDALIICVPTPLTKSREPDLKYVEASTRSIAKTLRPGQLVVLESTTYPGTTVELMLPILAESGLQVEEDFALAYSPEREDPGNPNYGTANIPKVVGGFGPQSTRMAMELYGLALEKLVPVSSTQVAEMTKLFENIFRSVNIALVNEMKMLCHRMKIDVCEVIDAAASKPFGFMPFYPGPGLGGHCIPIDPFYLTSKAREYDFSTKFIELAGEINTSMPYYVVQQVMDALNQRGKSLHHAAVLVLGVAYKKNIDDDRESPSYKLMELLREKGAVVSYSDPHIPELRKTRKYSFALKSVSLTPEVLAAADCVLLATDHTAYDYDFILEHAQLIVDTRNAFVGKSGAGEKVYLA
ncbi:MAG: nucleotide sugar dehydrogenase [Chlorobium sp.]|nr:nucleotide sugar dehydrogenase [Chlorobium sp.]